MTTTNTYIVGQNILRRANKLWMASAYQIVYSNIRQILQNIRGVRFSLGGDVQRSP